MALTYVPGFFEKLGFRIVSMESLPEKVFGVCVICPKFDHCDEIAMVKSLICKMTQQIDRQADV